MKKLFLVTTGVYENEWPVGVFTTRELALAYIEASPCSLEGDWGEAARIEEIDLDPTRKQQEEEWHAEISRKKAEV